MSKETNNRNRKYEPDRGPNDRDSDFPERQRPPKSGSRSLIGILLVVLGLIALYIWWSNSNAQKQLTVKQFDDLLASGGITKIVYYTDASELDVTYKGQADTTVTPKQNETPEDAAKRTDREAARQAGVETTVTMNVSDELFMKQRTKLIEEKIGEHYTFSKRGDLKQTLLVYILPLALLVIFFYFMVLRPFRGAGGVPGGVLSFGRSRARLANKERPTVTFDDVAGIEEAKDEVREIIEFLKDPARFRKLGGRVPRGVLLVGAPGTGKTLLAKAVAGEAHVPFFSISGSDFVEMFVGVGAARVRDLFAQAKENAPCIIFLDEIDAVGRKRGYDPTSADREGNQTLNAILVEIDGFDTDDKIIVMAATNRPDMLDPALLRPGRFDREIMLDLPDIRGREQILKIHSRKVKLAPDADLARLARLTATFSGAELEAIINEAAINAAMHNLEAVTMDELEEARDKIRFGREKRSRVMSEEDREITAYHESGHAVLSKVLKGVDPLHKVGIVPRGMALGATMSMPEKDEYHVSKNRILAQITMALGGRIAEEMFCHDITSGAQSDLEMATRLARYMVTKWGMSAKLGPVDYGEDAEHMTLAKEISGARPYSEATAVDIDEEIRRIMNECMEHARTQIEQHRTQTEAIAKALLIYETLDSGDVDLIMQGKDLSEKKQMVYNLVDGEHKPGGSAPPVI